MKKIYIVTIYDVERSGGLSTYVKNLQQLYLSQEISVSVITPFTQKHIAGSIFVILSKTMYCLHKYLGLLFYYKILCFLIGKQFPQEYNQDTIFHFQDVVSLYYCFPYISEKCNKILTLHGDLTNMNLSDRILKKNTLGYRYSLYIEKAGYMRANRIIAVDERLKNHALTFGIDGKKIRNIPNFTDTRKFFSIDSVEKKSLRKKYGLANEKKIIFCPRRLVEKNGVIFTIDIIKSLDDNFLLLITGEGPEKIKVIDKIKSLGVSKKVIITGDISNNKIKEYYCLSDLVIIPSINSNGVIEATSISAIESMSCGIPVIASDIGGLKELINNGFNGYLCSEREINSFIQAIHLFFSLSLEKKKNMEMNAIYSVKHNFSAQSYFTKISEFIFTNK